MKKTLHDLDLDKDEVKALFKLKARVHERFPEAQLILYGLRSKGSMNGDSHFDVLILLDIPSKDMERGDVEPGIEKEIKDIALDAGARYGVSLNVTIKSKTYWQTPFARRNPLYLRVDKEGICL